MKYIVEYKVLLCIACPESYCIPPERIERHLREHHKNILSKKQRTELVKYSKTLELLKPTAVHVPCQEEGPIPGLHCQEGYVCTICKLVCGAESSMETHCRDEHDWRTNKPIIWKEQLVQVLITLSLPLI